MLKWTNLFLCILLTWSVWAQNLLPNCGFEDVNICCENDKPCCPKGWFKTNFSKYTSTSYPKPGMNNSFAAEIVAAAIGGNNFRTYLQAPILSQLIAGKEYTVSMYVMPKQFLLDELGVYFSDTFTVKFTDDRLNIPYQLKLKSNKKFIGKRNTWTKISASYKATGSEQFIVVGNFKSDKELYWKRIKGKSEVCSYLIDSVSLVPNDSSTKYETSESELAYFGETRRHYLAKKCTGSNHFISHLLPDSAEHLDDAIDTFFTQKSIILKNVFFDFDKTDLLPNSYTELNILVNYLQLHPTYFIKISGHTDAKGSDEYNLKLSAGRAKSIANYLELNGIDSYRIQFEGNGSKEPIANNNTDKGREQNRRVEFIIFE
jgi:outer membrane protein OmpA-like peptidoglycan-associated protein